MLKVQLLQNVMTYFDIYPDSEVNDLLPPSQVSQNSDYGGNVAQFAVDGDPSTRAETLSNSNAHW